MKLCDYCIDHTASNVILSPKFGTSLGKEYFMILLIMSSYRQNASIRRQIIRETWANHSLYLPFKVKHFFVLGMFEYLFICIHT